MTVAYVVNQYPKVSHIFIRREIAALRSLGLRVQPYSIRDTSSECINEADRAELKRTQTILRVGLTGLLLAAIGVALRRPGRFADALWLALRIGWGSDRGWLRHLAYLAEAAVLRVREYNGRALVVVGGRPLVKKSEVSGERLEQVLLALMK